MALEIVLISPKYLKKETLFWNLSYALEETSKMWRQPIRSPSYPLALPLIASLIQKVKKDCNIQIIDENVHPIDFSNVKPDLVCITANTLQIERSFQIANEFREKTPEAKILLGGAHFGNSKDYEIIEIIKEALNYVDSIVIGESDNLWENIINDFERKKLEDTYTCDNIPQLDKLVLPCFDLLPLELYLFRNLQASRGCNRQCSFCTVNPNLRLKPADNVIEEIKHLRTIEHNKNIEHRSIFFSDNLLNPLNHSELNKAKELMEKLIKYKEKRYLQDKLTWDGQVDSKIGMKEFDELLNLMARSGAQRLLIGFENFYFYKDSEKISLSQMKKNFLNAVKKVREKGIDVIGSFMIGFDEEADSIFDETYDFINESGLVLAQITVLTPFPGTSDFRRFQNEKRLLKCSWNKYDCTNFVFSPLESINNKQIQYYKLLKKIYDDTNIEKRKRKRQEHMSSEAINLFSEELIIKSFQRVSDYLI